MTIFENLKKIRAYRKQPMWGLQDEVLRAFAQDHNLQLAVAQAVKVASEKAPQLAALQEVSEEEAGLRIQDRIYNFYAPEAINPYVPLAAQGPWIVTLTGCVLHDSGGYGMLGLGHNPPCLDGLWQEPQVMANVMTPSLEQLELIENLDLEIGRNRAQGSGPVYDGYLFLNSGSESVTMASRIADVNSKIQTKPGGAYEGKKLAYLSVQGSFHGRTDKPAQVSDSCLETYRKHLASFEKRSNLYAVPSNDPAALKNAFDRAVKDGAFIEAVFLEPVMGEGNPGVAITPEFYATARRLTLEANSMLVIDSIQAGLRTRGVLSIVDYPGFENLPAPDLETFSKAINAGQFPLSVLAMGKRAGELHRVGLYGNTMTGNPRAMRIASCVLKAQTAALRQNIVKQGDFFLHCFRELMQQYPRIIEYVRGTGLLFAVGINSEVIEADGLEKRLRHCGIGVIHGGENALRFTPHFAITPEEVRMIVAQVEAVIQKI